MKGNPIILNVECITRALTLWRVDLLALFQKSQHHSGSLVSLVCLMPAITIGVSIPVLQSSCFLKKKQKHPFAHLEHHEPFVKCWQCWAGVAYHTLAYLTVEWAQEQGCVFSSLAPCAQSCLQCGKYRSMGQLRGEHRDDNCSCWLSACVASPLLDIAVPFFMLNCW